MWLEILIGTGTSLVILYFYFQKRPRDYPPGPWGFPFIGHLPLIGNAPFQTFQKWKKRYGPIVAVDFGQFPTVAISDYKLIREANGLPEFNGRPDLQPFLDRSEGQRRGVIFSDGAEWLEQRRFTFTHLKNFGFGKNSEESVLKDEYSDLISYLMNKNGEPVAIRDVLQIANINAIWMLATSERFEKTDPNLTLLLNAIQQNIEENNGLAAAGMFFPWLTKMFPKLLGYDQMMKDLVPLLEFLDKPVQNHVEGHVRTESPRDFLEAYLNEIKQTKNPASSFFGKTGIISMRTVLLDLFTAGSETSTTTLVFFTLYMALYPKIQQKLRQLIENKFGDSIPSLNDRIRLPYVEATVLEILRITSIIPSGIFRRTMEDVKFHGYKIPKDTMIILNLYYANHDSEYWGDPEVFRPERFLSYDKTKVIKHEAFLAFGSGKRECPGQKLALNQIFLFVVMILQKFEILLDPQSPVPSLEPIVSFVLMPQKHQLIFKPRVQ